VSPSGDPPARPLPHPDRDSQPYWDFIRKGELRLQRCDRCGTWRFPPRAICGSCHSFEATWTPTRGLGTVTSWITTHQVFAPAYRDDVPYVVVQVALDEQPDLILPGRLVSGAEPREQLRVRAVPLEVAPDVSLVFWDPVGQQ
jgi:uncharacterized OB-fold protein